MQRALVVRAREGDLEAFAQLVRAALPRLEGVARLILRDPGRAEDAVQDALVSAWRDLRALREPDAWDAWIRRLTVRACYKVAHRERRRALVELRATLEPHATIAPDAAAGLVEREHLGRELGRLSLDQRAVIVLHYYLDLPLPEVAEILDIPIGTAGSRLHRGLEALRRSMRVDSRLDGRYIGEAPS